MLKDITDLIRVKAKNIYEKYTDVPNEQAEATAEATGASIFEVLKTKILEGDFVGVKNVLSGVSKDDLKELPIVKNIIEMTSKQMQENGIDKEVADKAAEDTVPSVVEQLSEKYASEAEEDAHFSLKGLFVQVFREEGRVDLLDKAKETLGLLGSQLEGLGDKVGDALGDLKEKAGGLDLGGLTGKVGSLLSGLSEKVSEGIEDISEKVGEQLDGLKDKVEDSGEKVEDQLDDLKDKAEDAGENAEEAGESLFEKGSDLLGSLFGKKK